MEKNKKVKADEKGGGQRKERRGERERVKMWQDKRPMWTQIECRLTGRK